MSDIKAKNTILAIVSAMTEELEFLGEYLQDRDGWKKTEDNRYVNAGQRLEIVSKVLGVGKVCAAYGTADIINEYTPDLIVNVGYAGGLIKDAERGDVAIGTDYVQVDLIPFFKNNIPYIAPSSEVLVNIFEKEASKLEIRKYKGRIATGDFFLHNTEQKNRILEAYSPIAFDMESAAIAQVATAKNVPFIALRTFSDMADDTAAEQALANKREKETGHRKLIEHQPIKLAVNTAERYADLIKKTLS